MKKNLSIMAFWMIALLLLCIGFVNGKAAYAESVSENEIQAQLGIFNFDELTNVSEVETSKDGNYQSFDVYFESGVYYGGSDGYVDEWLTSDGIVAEIEIDMDGDQQDEYVALYVKPVWEYGYRYDEFRIVICEAENGKYVKKADFECSFDMYGFGERRYVKIVSCDEGALIVSGEDDAPNISMSVFSYDGQKAYVELIACFSPYALNNEYDYEFGYSYALKSRFSAEKFADLYAACRESQYDRSKLEKLLPLNDNNFVSSKSGSIEKCVQFARDCGVWAEFDNDVIKIADSIDFAESSEKSKNRNYFNQMRFYTSLDHVGGTASLTGQENKTDSNKTDNDQSTSGAVYVHGSSNLRSGPGLSYGTVSSVADGKTLVWLGEVSVDDRGVMWYKVLRNNGEAAWISSRYSELKTSDGSEPEIPFGKLMKGNKGERVLELQTMLKELGYHTGSCDGDYGSGTEKSVKAFQEAFKEKAGLIVTGEVDEATWNAIKEALEPEKVEEEIGDISFEEILEEITEGEEYPNTAYISQINRTALDRWLNNKDENYSHNSGYMLLEQTLDANSNGVWTAVADNMFSYAFDFLHLLLDSYSGNAAGGVSGALDLSVSFGLEFYDAEAIERMLIETYAEYMADMQQEAQAAQDQYNANLNLYRAYMKVKELYEAGDFVLKTAEPGDTAVRTVKFMIQEDLSLRDMAYLSLDRSEAMSRAISACLTEGNVQAGEIEALNEMINKYNKYHESAVQLRESGIGDKLSQWGYALDALSLVNSSLALCEKYGYEAERYAGMIGFMAYSSAEYLAMLDEWAQAAEEMGAGKYADAIEQFRKDFEIITRQQVEKLIMNNAGQESMDEVVDVLNATAAVVGDTVEVYRKSKGIATTQTFSWSLVSRTAETMIRDAMEWDEKAELMEKMVYCRNLKETLASSLQKQLSEFDAMADGEAKEEKAAVIIAGLKYMKSLKYHGEGLALNLCELLTEAGNYMQSDYQLVAKINGTWAVIGGVVQPADGGYYTDTPLDLVQMEGLEYGYIKNGNITMMNAGDNGVFWRLAHRQVWIEWVPTMTDALMDEMIMTTEEMLEDQEMKARINERKRQENAQMPEHIEYWEKYVEDFSIPAIEWIE